MVIVTLLTALTAPPLTAEETAIQSDTRASTLSTIPEHDEPSRHKNVNEFTCNSDLAYHFDKECAAFDAVQSEAGKALCCHSVSVSG
ncbi:MAG: hypothetical protein AABZ84_10150 [Pseudomonadota bacterium]